MRSMEYADRGPEYAEELQENQYRKLREAFEEGSAVAYSLTVGEPILLEFHATNGTWRSISLGYGSIEPATRGIRITTSRNPVVQPPGAGAEPLDIPIDGSLAPAVLLRGADDTWLLTTSAAGFFLSVSGEGPPGDITLHALHDINPAIDARKAYIKARQRQT